MIAIDFGTSRIKLAYWDPKRGEARLMRLGRGDAYTIPSLFYVSPDGAIGYGTYAKKMLEVDPAGVMHTLKRRLRDRTIRLNRQRVTPEALVTHVLQDLRTRAGDDLPTLEDGPPDRLALTLPARFGPIEEELMQRAAKAAGFTEVSLISEPVAAAQAWLRETGEHADHIIILDCGGGTVDWAYVQRDNASYREISALPAGGDEKIGGHDLDEELLKVLLGKYEDLEADAAVEAIESKRNTYLEHMRELKEDFAARGKVNPRLQPEVLGQTAEFTEGELGELFAERFTRQVLTGFKSFVERVRAHVEGDLQVLLVGGSAQLSSLKSQLDSECGVSCRTWERAEFATVLGAVETGLSPAKVEPLETQSPEVAVAASTTLEVNDAVPVSAPEVVRPSATEAPPSAADLDLRKTAEGLIVAARPFDVDLVAELEGLPPAELRGKALAEWVARAEGKLSALREAEEARLPAEKNVSG